MNISFYRGLPIYKTLSGLTPDFVDKVNVFILPIIAVNSLITNLLCMIVFSNKVLFRNPTYKYLFYVSLSDFIYSLINSFIGIMRCGSLCPYGYNYWLKMYEIYIFQFFARVFEVSGVLIDIKLSLSRLFAFKKQSSSSKKNRYKLNIIISLLIGSIIICPYSTLTKEVRLFGYLNNSHHNNHTNSMPIELYSITLNSIGRTDYGKQIVIIFLVFKGIILQNILSIINLIVFIKFRSHIKTKKLNFKSFNSNEFKHQKELKTTLLIILVCLWRYLGDLQNSVAAISFMFVSSYTFSILTIISNGIQWMVYLLFILKII